MNDILRYIPWTLLLAAIGVANADDGTFIVTRTDDPLPNGCSVGGCSLREAVLAANENTTGANEIVLGAETYTVGAPTIVAHGTLRITGAGSANTLVNGNGDVLLLQHFGESLLVQGVALDAASNMELFADGDRTVLVDVAQPNTLGSLIVSGSTDSVIADSDFRGSVNLSGNCTVTVETSQFVHLSFVQGNPVTCSVRLDRIVVDGSLSAGSSGLAFNLNSAAGDSTIGMFNSVIQHTTDGMALRFTGGVGQASIEHLRYLDNDEPLLMDYGIDAYIQDSEFADNHHDDEADPKPGALWVHEANVSTEVQRSTFSGNRGTRSAGGAVLVEGGASLTLVNSTFANNTFTVAAAETGVRGAAIGYYSDDQDVTVLRLKHVTIVPPALFPTGVAGTTIGGYGGETGLSLNVYNSILRGSCSLDADAMDVAVGSISTGTSCQFTDPSNQTGVSSSDIGLGTLDYHGGYTRTYVPAADSVAVDAGYASVCLDEDQRGYVRPLGNGCDVGAVETGDVLFANGFE